MCKGPVVRGSMEDLRSQQEDNMNREQGEEDGEVGKMWITQKI